MLFIVAVPVALLLHVPPVVVVLSVVEPPAHNAPDPVMLPGSGFTVIAAVVLQVVGSVYVIVTAVGTLTAPPVTRPVVAPIGAALVLLLVQVPPPLLPSVTELPRDKAPEPVIGDGSGFTVIVFVTKQPGPML